VWGKEGLIFWEVVGLHNDDCVLLLWGRCAKGELNGRRVEECFSTSEGVVNLKV
jgi:hypothetical protein